MRYYTWMAIGVHLTMAVRLDKWLWAARFFKTRNLAITAVRGGKVLVDGQRAKPSRYLKGSEQLKITKGREVFNIEVRALSERRMAAKLAAEMYVESDESKAERERLQSERKFQYHGMQPPKGRPNKRDRQKIRRFKNINS